MIPLFPLFLSLCCTLSLVLLPTPTTHSEQSATVEIKITNLRSNKGKLLLGFYKDDASFSKRQPYMNKLVEKTNYNNGEVTYRLTMPYGTHGVALLDDENNNGKVDYGFILPTEGFGFSDYYHKGLTSPSFGDFDFNVASNFKTVVIKVKYM